jgi:hypothetical protein
LPPRRLAARGAVRPASTGKAPHIKVVSRQGVARAVKLDRAAPSTDASLHRSRFLADLRRDRYGSAGRPGASYWAPGHQKRRLAMHLVSGPIDGL